MSTARLNESLDPLDLFGGQASRQAHDIQTELADIGLQLQRDFGNELREDEAPVRQARNDALEFLKRIQSGDASITADPSLRFRTENAVRDIGTSAASRGKFNSGGRLVAEQDARAQLTSQDTGSQLNRLLNVAGFETGDLITNNQLIAQNADSQANQMQNIGALNQANSLGQSNALFSGFGQAAQGLSAVGPEAFRLAKDKFKRGTSSGQITES